MLLSTAPCRLPADAAALKAREAAASCDAALNPVDADEDFVHKMRGWLMTVATLFVSTAYQAAIQPPDWMTCLKPHGGNKYSFSCELYKVCIVFTMSMALAMLVGLLAIEKVPHRYLLPILKVMLTIISATTAISFIVAITTTEKSLLSTTIAFWGLFTVTAYLYYGLSG
jgi:hypothetical protein